VPEIWDKAMEKSKNEGRNLAAVIRRLVELWVKGEIDLKW